MNAKTITAIAILALLSACVTKGHDPIVVQAERSTELAKDLFNQFLLWEHRNADALSGTPEIKQAADLIRANGVRWLQSARTMTKAYKNNRTPENKANLDTAMKVLESAVDEIKRYWVGSQSEALPVQLGPCQFSYGIAKEPPLGSAALPAAFILALLDLLIANGPAVVKWVKDAKGRGEWTPEEEAAIDAKIAELELQDHWKIRPD